jgi:thiamine-monophosphate kinase
VWPWAMMDLSDGLAKDLPRLAKASGCGFRIDREAIPRAEACSVEQALGDGEDFELLFAAAPSDDFTAEWSLRFPELALTRIGKLVEAGEGEQLSGGWDHFG